MDVWFIIYSQDEHAAVVGLSDQLRQVSSPPVSVGAGLHELVESIIGRINCFDETRQRLAVRVGEVKCSAEQLLEEHNNLLSVAVAYPISASSTNLQLLVDS